MLAIFCLMQHNIPLASFAARAHWWLTFNFSRCQQSSFYYRAPSFLMTCFQTACRCRCARLCPGAEGISRLCSLTTFLGAGSWCARSALLQCSCDPGSGCCENSYIVRKSCQNLFWGLPTSLGSCLGPCLCSLPDFPFPTWPWTCLKVWALRGLLHSSCCCTLGLHPMWVRALPCQQCSQLSKPFTSYPVVHRLQVSRLRARELMCHTQKVSRFLPSLLMPLSQRTGAAVPASCLTYLYFRMALSRSGQMLQHWKSFKTTKFF